MSHLSREISETVVVGPGPLDELVGHAVAVQLLVAAQACEIRGGLAGRPAIETVACSIRGLSPPLADDRPLDGDIEAVYQAVAAGALGQPVPAEA